MIARTVVAKGSEGKGETVRVMTNFGPSTRSDDQGHFRFEKLKPGAYVLGAAKKGYRKLSSHPIDLAESQTARGVELRLGQPGRIFVKVTDEAGAPIVGASVRRRSSAMMFVSRSPSNPDPNGADAPRQTDAEGIALLEGIDATELAVEASAPGFATTSKTVSMTSFEVSIEMTLRPGRVLKGRLINAKTKAPVSEVHLNAFPKENTSPAEMTSNNATTDSDGRFEFGPLRPGEYVLSSFAPNLAPLNKRVELSSGEGPMVLPDIEMTEVRELAVRVLDPDGKALESASVRVYAIETAGIRRISFGTLTENQSDANGLITLSGLEPVRSHVSASKSGFGSGWLADQDLSDPSLQQLEIRLCRPASFEGTARDANGLPLSRTTISLLRLGFSQPIATLDTDSEGRFRFQDLGPGQYVLVRGAFPRAQPEDKDLITIVEAESLISDITLP